MSDLKATLRKAWDARFGDEFERDVRLSRTLVTSDGRTCFDVHYSQKLEEWYLSETGQTRYERPACFLCAGYDEYRRTEQVLQFEHLAVNFNIKFVTPCHFLIAPLEHRDTPTIEDILTLHLLAKMSGLSIFGNLRNSGASYPIHVHYQSLETIFPIMARPRETLVSGETLLSRVVYPAEVLSFGPFSEKGPEAAAKVIVSIDIPYNPLFCGGQIFIAPRTKSVPSNTDNFKFAAAEVYGSVFTRQKKIFRTFTAMMMEEALREVCLPFGSAQAASFEKEIVLRMQEVRS